MVKETLIALDQALNTIIKLDDGWGKPDEMMSSRAWRLRWTYPRLYKIIDKIFFWDDNHCQECYEIEKANLQKPEEYWQ